MKFSQFIGIYDNPTEINKLLNKRYKVVFKPVLDKLREGTTDDKKLAKQLEDKLINVKRSYAVKQIKPLLGLKNE